MGSTCETAIYWMLPRGTGLSKGSLSRALNAYLICETQCSVPLMQNCSNEIMEFPGVVGLTGVTGLPGNTELTGAMELTGAYGTHRDLLIRKPCNDFFFSNSFNLLSLTVPLMLHHGALGLSEFLPQPFTFHFFHQNKTLLSPRVRISCL